MRDGLAAVMAASHPRVNDRRCTAILVKRSGNRYSVGGDS